jgi:hypothetical protein
MIVTDAGWDAVDATTFCARWDRRASRKTCERSPSTLTRDVGRGRQNRVVLTPRRWRQVCGVASAQPGLDKIISAGDGGKRARSPGRARHKPLKPLRAGMPGVPVYLWLLPLCFLHCTGGFCGCRGHPAFPTPSLGRRFHARLGRIAPRGREVVSGIGAHHTLSFVRSDATLN